MPPLMRVEVDNHAIFMERSASRRGIKTEYVNLPFSTYYDEPVKWLAFQIMDQKFYYRNSMLLFAGLDRWGRLGLHVNGMANLLIRDKHRAKGALRARGFNTPKGQVFRRGDLDRALAAFAGFDGPVCVKPNQSGEGKRVTPLIRNYEQYERAVRGVAADHGKILVEESVGGHLFRFFFVRPSVVAVKLSRPASVVGDGVSPIARLVERKNAWRRQRAVVGHKPILLDDEAADYLRLQGLCLADVPAGGERVFLRGTSNGATGADSIAIPGALHPSYTACIEAACNSIDGLNITTVDAMIRDPQVPEDGGNYWILEMNRNAGVPPYHCPWKGESQDVCGAVLDFLERGGTPELR